MDNSINRICVFSGSSPGSRPEYARAAKALGHELVQHKIELVYGGGHVGLMGTVADAVMSAGGRVTGVIPEFIAKKEIAHYEITKLHVVDSMHERKAMMSELSDGFIALPGGLGTFEELLEILTWNQLGVHSKPCVALNTCHYFQPLFALLEHAVAEQFLKTAHRDMLLSADTAAGCVHLVRHYEHSHTDKWPGQGRVVDDFRKT